MQESSTGWMQDGTGRAGAWDRAEKCIRSAPAVQGVMQRAKIRHGDFQTF
jgi:hypothetical protein